MSGVPERFASREAEFRDFTRRWIEQQDERYREIETTKVAQSKPIRHPKGQRADRHSREFLWSDALWCQDRHSEPFELFFSDEDKFVTDMLDHQGCDDELGQTWDWLTEIFNDEFRKACPDIAHVLEG
jgi:hypothetical protein